MRPVLPSLIFILTLLVPGAARADIFHCVDAAGNLAFRDTPCPDGTRTAAVTNYVPAEMNASQLAETERQRALAEARRIQ